VNQANAQRRKLLLGGGGLLAAPWVLPVGAQVAPASVQAQLGGAMVPRRLQFPRDHGTHERTRTEWWYLTGSAQSAQGRAFGFQVTFFRSRVDEAASLQSRLAAKHILFAHAAITDVQGARLWHDQRIHRWNGERPAQRERGVFASDQDMQVVLRDWFIQRNASGAYTARVVGGDIGIDLQASPTQAILLQGDQGFSRKGPDPAQASFYVSHPQLDTRGTLTLQGQAFAVSGHAWLDHEWSESLLHPQAVGWDWIGMNLFDGSSLTAFQLRRADGSKLWAGGSFRTMGDAQRATGNQPFNPDEIHWSPRRYWTSPTTRARYPVEWSVRTPAGVYTVKAVIDPQELDSRQGTGTVYWEGLSDLFDRDGKPVGRGYLEMTGYAQRMVL
jgi:predicted secreted hydrolase